MGKSKGAMPAPKYSEEKPIFITEWLKSKFHVAC